jgi:hypothetical protein
MQTLASPKDVKRRTLWTTLALVLASIMGIGAQASTRFDVARFSAGSLDGWKSQSLEGMTLYTLEQEAGRPVLRAVSEASASGLYRELRVDLRQTPFLNWSWRIDRMLGPHDERSRKGDDYPARVYVVFSAGVAFWRTRAINYVWSAQPLNSVWPNAWDEDVRMVAAHSGPRDVGQWVAEKRNVLADYRRLFGEEPSVVDAVAIMTDTDNTGETVRAWYGDIWFSGD